jgi:hypothetical protein
MKREVSLEYLDYRLSRASRLLDECAKLIRDLELNPQYNITKIAEALTRIFEIRSQIYDQRPDLMPDFLKKRPSSKEPRPE